MAIVPVTKAVRRTKAASVENNKIIDNQIDIDSRVTTNAAAINTNEAAILSLAATGVPGLTANFNIVEWDYLDSTTGIVPGQEYYRFNKPPGPTGELGDFTDTTIELTPPRDIDEIRWLNAGTLQFYGSSGTDSTWGTSLKANTTLSLYIYSKGSTSPKLTEYELASGTTFTWGAGNMGSGIQYSASLPDGMSETTEIRFLVAEKGQLANVRTYLGLHLPSNLPSLTNIGTWINTAAKDGFWYETNIDIPITGNAALMYQINLRSGSTGGTRYMYSDLWILGADWDSRSIGSNTLVSGTTEYDNSIQYTYFTPASSSSGFAVCRVGTRLWVCQLFMTAPANLRVSVTNWRP